jgi:hypothetical protein
MEFKEALMKAVLCPVCNGVGQVSAGFYNHGGDCPLWSSSDLNPEICRSCGGKGWIEVSDEEPKVWFKELEWQAL